MNGAYVVLAGTLLSWVGWIALLRAVYLGFRIAFRVEPHLRERQVKGAVLACAVGGVGLVGAATLRVGEPWSFPLVWVMMPFTGWVAAAAVVAVAWRSMQAWTALNAVERGQRLMSVLAWAVAGALGLWVFKATDGGVEILRGKVDLSPAWVGGLVAFSVVALAAMVSSARATRSRGWAKTAVTHTALVIGSVVFGLPFAWLVVTSFKEDNQIGGKEGIEWVPRVQVTVPYDDPANPYYETSYQGTKVRAAQIGKRTGGRVTLEVTRPYSLQGAQFDASAKTLRRVPQDAKVVTAEFGGKPVKAFVAENLNDGRTRLRVMEPAGLKGTEFITVPSDTKPLLVAGMKAENYGNALEFLPTEANMGLTYLRNTLILVVMTLLGTILSSALVAYGFSRLRFPGKNALFAVLLSTMMLPGAVTMLPSFLIFRSLGWIDTLYPLWVPAFFASAFNVFLLRQFFSNIPMELEDAAKIDGCSYLRTFWQVMMPQIKPALAVIAIWTFLGAWNNFMGPLIYVSSPENMPIAYAVQLFQNDRGGEPALTMAFATMAMMPVLLLFFFAQKYFIEGVQLTGLGGR